MYGWEWFNDAEFQRVDAMGVFASDAHAVEYIDLWMEAGVHAIRYAIEQATLHGRSFDSVMEHIRAVLPIETPYPGED